MSNKTEFGIKIWNISAGSIFEVNQGTREKLHVKKAMFVNSLLLDYLMENGLTIVGGSYTRDVIGVDFDYGAHNAKDEIKKIQRIISQHQDDVEYVKTLEEKLEFVKAHEDLYVSKTSNELREDFYRDGISITYYKHAANGRRVPDETIHYRYWYRSTGKAKAGKTVFIRDELYDVAIDFIRMGIKLPDKNAKIVEMSAYSALIGSGIVGYVDLQPENILILKDVDSYFRTNVVSVETDENKECILKHLNDYEVKNTLWDGMALIDERIFPKRLKWLKEEGEYVEPEGFVLLRQHMFKACAFNTNIQMFFKDYYKDAYETAEIEDMFGIKHRAKDIKLITTDNAVKWIKFGVSYEYWCDYIHKTTGDRFGVVKTSHPSKFGKYQKTSYQMINTLSMDIMPSVAESSVNYINQLKTDDKVYLKYLADNKNFSNDYEVLLALVEQDPEFIKSEYFRYRRANIISEYVKKFKLGKTLQNAENLTICFSPYALLLYTVGEDIEKDETLCPDEDAVQVYTKRFACGEMLAGFRNPHCSQNNILALQNVRHPLMEKYFNFDGCTMAVNARHTDVQDRASGEDADGDTNYVTNEPNMVAHAYYCYKRYPTIVNNVAKSSKSYDNTPEDFAKIDNALKKCQANIGETANNAQLSLTYGFNFDDVLYEDVACIFSTLSQIAIDSAKREFDVDVSKEIVRLKNVINVKGNGIPKFYAAVQKVKGNVEVDKIHAKTNYNLKCPVNYLFDVKVAMKRTAKDTRKMEDFFVKYKLAEDRRKCKKVEELIQKYSIRLTDYSSEQSTEDDSTESLVFENDFDELIRDIRQTYISKNYLGLMSWLIDRAFCITSGAKRKQSVCSSSTKYNLPLLMNTLYKVSPSCFLQVWSKNLQS